MLVEKDLNKLIRILNVNEIHKFKFEEDYKIAKQIDKKLKRMALEKNRLD